MALGRSVALRAVTPAFSFLSSQSQGDQVGHEMRAESWAVEAGCVYWTRHPGRVRRHLLQEGTGGAVPSRVFSNPRWMLTKKSDW